MGHGTLEAAQRLVGVRCSDVEQATVAVADQSLEVVVLALGGPAVHGLDRRAGLGQLHAAALGELHRAGGHGLLRRRGGGGVLLEQGHLGLSSTM